MSNLPGHQLKSKWECSHCDEIHDSMRDAEECCPREIREVWECPGCKEYFTSSDEAYNHCADEDGNVSEYRPSHRELEDAGQLRLLP